MAIIPKKWIVKTKNENLVNEISQGLNISRTVATVLVNRGVKSIKAANMFMNLSFYDLNNPYLLPDMETAVKRTRRAVDNKEKILVYGDRDLDGVSSVTVVYSTLKLLGVTPLWYIPSTEGYGMHKSVIDKYIEQGVTLIITVDCGITNSEEIAYAKSKGAEVIVTDHHEPPKNMPLEAVALIDPKRKDSKYNFNDLSGCSVALKFTEGLLMSYDKYYDKEMFVLDIETTGFHPVFDNISEIGVLKIKDFVIREKLQIFVGTGADCCDIESASEKLLGFIGENTVITHNAEFNIGFIRQLTKKFYNREFDNSVIDTLTLSREYFPFESYGLGSLTGTLGIEQIHSGHAIDDAILTLQVFERLEKIRNNRLKFFLQDNLDVASIATISDMMPLVGENRIIVKQGIESLKKTRRIGLKLLIEQFSKKEDLNTKSISFNIIPLLNACGRLGRAELAVELLIAEDVTKAEKILDEIIKLNQERKELQSENIDKFIELLKKQCDTEKDKLFFVSSTGIEHGVTGIVASQIVRQYNRPTLLLIIEGQEAVGTGRSIGGFNIHKALERCGDLLVKFGGHSQAVGFTVAVDKIAEFKNRMIEIANQEVTSEMLEPILEIDSQLKLSEVNMELVNELNALEPFGIENPYPIFLINNVKVDEHSLVGTGNNHLKLKMSENGHNLYAIGWNLADLSSIVFSVSKYIDAVAQLEINRWQNRENVQLQLLDIKPVL
ncbi:MAG: single-stranded-DNA-specific exonuclease RecJ [Elusimicrobia bacterium]|nr:single-stranded-DNA-specific exonuclease RecJ [Elusimicrobiota bacterium]MBU2614295.1 single-stranded-DNA-specific exonuclease RecJ [Elusimicrobiota bacterium]